MSKSSFVHGKANVEKLERGARELLGIPRLPDGGSPDMLPIVAQMRAEYAANPAASLTRWAQYATTAHACRLDTDAGGSTIASLEHTTQKGQYHYPHSAALEKALTNPQARAKCSATALSALDDHRGKLTDLPDDWRPKGQTP